MEGESIQWHCHSDTVSVECWIHLHHRKFMLDALRIELWVVAQQRLDCNFDVGLALFVPKAADREGTPVSRTDGDDRCPRAKHAAYKIKYRECTHSPSASPTSYPCRFTMEGSESLAVGVTNRRAHSGVQKGNEQEQKQRKRRAQRAGLLPGANAYKTRKLQEGNGILISSKNIFGVTPYRGVRDFF